MIKSKRNHDIFQPFSSTKNLAQKLSYSTQKDKNSKKQFVHRVTLKLITNDSDSRNSRSNNNKQQSKPNLIDQGNKTPKVREFHLQKVNNIKTFIRFRPFSITEIEASDKHIQNLIVPTNNNSAVYLGDTAYHFDRVFKSDETQLKIFEETAKQILYKVLDGYNGTLFAYGQTGSGKTHTMFGDHRKGIIPLTIKELFKCISNKKCKVSCSLLEIYKQTLIDLIDPDKTDLKIKETTNGIQVVGLTVQTVQSQQELISVVNKGNQIKKIRQTSINEYSSRSHFIFMINLEQKGQDREILRSKLNLIDLAGSEKVYKSKASGEGLEQAKKINLSLSCLSNTINALTKNQEHIPFRESKLTRILQQSLVGNCITSLIVTCSSHISCTQQTISSLKFANRTKSIKTSITKNIVKQKEEVIKKQIYESLKSQFVNCEQKLQRVKSVIECAKKTTYNPHDRFIHQISSIVENATRTSEYQIQKSKRVNSEEKFIQNSKVKQNLEKSLEASKQQVVYYKNIIVKQELIIEQHEKKLKQLSSKIQNLEKRYKNNIELEQINKKQLNMLENEKLSYQLFEKEILQKQIKGLMDKLYNESNQSTWQFKEFQRLMAQNRFTDQYIKILQKNLAHFIKLFLEQIQQEAFETEQGKYDQQIIIENELLPLTYQKSIELIKKKNQLILKLLTQNKQSLAKQKDLIENQNFRLKRKIQILEAQLKLQIQKFKHFESKSKVN